MTKKFLLLSVPKSASNYLGARLSQDPNIIYVNAMFNKDFFATHFNIHNFGPSAKTGVLTEFVNLILSDEYIVQELVRLRTEKALLWLNSIMQMEPGGYLGAKLHPYLDIWYHRNGVIEFALDPALVTDFIAPKYNWQLITLSRQDIYEQMASCLISLKENYFDIVDASIKPEFFTDGIILNEELDTHKELLSIYKKCFMYIDTIRNRDNVIHIWYEDLISNNIPTNLLEFFNINSLPDVDGEKTFNRPYSTAFEDYDYFKKIIDKI